MNSIPNPILDSVLPVITGARHVRVHEQAIMAVGGWMAYEELPWPDFKSPLVPELTEPEVMDFLFLTSTINFAFTDFDSHDVFSVTYAGAERWDADAMFACLKAAHERGVPILEGDFLRTVNTKDLERIFEGNIRIPMLEARRDIFRDVGQVLTERYQGRFHQFVADSGRRLYDSGNGLLERLTREFRSFEDVSDYRGQPVFFQKRAQLLYWMLHCRFREKGFFELSDPHRLTAFADYILPLALKLLGILSYSPALNETIESRQIVEADGEAEIEIRAATIWSVHLLTTEINRLRPADRQVIDPIIDARLWTHYHATHGKHHLTITTDY